MVNVVTFRRHRNNTNGINMHRTWIQTNKHKNGVIFFKFISHLAGSSVVDTIV
jgi:hypothetical protein